jgi:hypothetical protein
MQTTQGLRNELVKRGHRLKYDMKISDLILKNTIDDTEIQRVARELFKVNKEHDSLR